MNMKKHVVSLAVASLLVALLGAALSAAPQEAVTIQVAPSTLNLQYSGTRVTVHAEFPYASVNTTTVTLENVAGGEVIEAVLTKSDDCGDLVAKFDLDDVKKIVAVGDVTLELGFCDTAGNYVYGTDTIRVIDKRGK